MPARLAMLRAAAVLVVLAVAPAVFAMSVKPLTNTPTALTVTLSSDRQVYTLGEPVMLTVHVANHTAAPIGVRKFSDAKTGMVWPRIRFGGGDFLRYVGPDFGVAHALIPETPLAPGEEFEASVRVLFNFVTKDDGDLPYFYAFDQAGTYQIRAEVVHVVPADSLLTDTIQIEMRAPTGSDAAVWKLLQKEDAAKLLHTGTAAGSSAEVDAFEQIVARYPESIYAGNLQASIAVQKKLNATGTPRAADGAATAIVDVAGRTMMATAPPSLTAAATEDASRGIAELVDAWVRAWNSRDTEKLLQYLSRDNALRQKWDQGEGDADRAAAARQFENGFATIGTLSIEVVGTTVGAQSASADLVVRADHADPRIAARTMEFVRDGGPSAPWRISEVGF